LEKAWTQATRVTNEKSRRMIAGVEKRYVLLRFRTWKTAMHSSLRERIN
jgi:hypothetical protein